MNFILRLEAGIRKRPKIYGLLRPLIPIINIFITMESDFRGLKYLDFTEKSGFAIDVGFNDGLSSTSIRKFFDGQVIAFEPLQIKVNPIVAKIVKDVNVVRIGLSDHPHKASIYTPTYRGKSYSPYSSTSRVQATQNLCRDLGVSASLIDFETNSISLKSLDSLNLCVAFIKIDTEGSEFEVLKGSLDTIVRSAPYMLIEVSNPESFKNISYFLSQYGYSSNLFQRNEFEVIQEWVPSRRNYWFLPTF